MAIAPLMNTPDPALQSLIASLQPNVLPSEPSVWPLALGYWLILAVTLLMVGSVFWFYRRQKKLKPVRQEIERIKQQPSTKTQLQQVHALLRWLLINRQGASKNLTDIEFEQRVQSTLGTDTHWVNAHYQDKPASIDWSQVEQLVRAWQKEVRS